MADREKVMLEIEKAINEAEYNWGWRCWTSRPSEQQMRDTKWEVELI